MGVFGSESGGCQCVKGVRNRWQIIDPAL